MKDKIVKILQRHPTARYTVSALVILAIVALAVTAVRNARPLHDSEQSYGEHLGSVPAIPHQVLR